MTEFTFTTDVDGEQTRFEPKNEDDSQVVTGSGEVSYTLTDDEMEYLEDLAEQRAQSYKDGETMNHTSGDHDIISVHKQGLKGEYVVSKLWGDGTVDESISAEGDDGLDATVEIDGTTLGVDVKVTTYEDAWLQQKKKGDYWTYPDGFFVCYSEKRSNTVTVKGWATKDELIRESNVEPSPAGGDWKNYTLRTYRNPPPVEKAL